jgi:hypothetical protein
MLVDLTEPELRRLLTLIELQEAHGVVTPEDRSVKPKLAVHAGNLDRLADPNRMRHYTDPTARRR